MKETVFRSIMSLLPQKVRDILVSRDPRFVTVTTYTDHVIRLPSVFYSGYRMSLNPKYRIEYLLMVNGIYDAKVVNMMYRLIDSDDIIIDIGANCGSMGIPMISRLKKNGVYVGIEPGPELFNRLKVNSQLNEDLIEGEIHLLNHGLASAQGKLFWEMDKGSNYGNASFVDYQTEHVIEVKKLDQIIDELNLHTVDFIKIDVEGMEADILESAITTIETFHPTILFESWVNQESPEHCITKKCIAVLECFGYMFFEPSKGEALFDDAEISYELIPVAYPENPQNTLAIHADRVDIMMARLKSSFEKGRIAK